MTEPWIGAVVAAGILAVFALGLLVPRRSSIVRTPVTDTKLDGLDSRLLTLERQQTKTDHDVRNIRMSLGSFLTKGSVHAVELKVTELAGKVENVAAQLGANTSSLGRIEDFLMKSTAEAIAHKITEDRK